MFLFSHCPSWVLMKALYILRFILLIYKIRKDHESSSPFLQQVYRGLFSVWPYRSYSSYEWLSQRLKLRKGQVQVWLVPWGRKRTLLTMRSWGYIPFILCCTECCLKQHFSLESAMFWWKRSVALHYSKYKLIKSKHTPTSFFLTL